MDNEALILAKQKIFTAETLLAVKNKSFTDFVIVYLAPKDHHHVHIPLDVRLT